MRIAIFHNLPSGGAKRTLFESVKRLVDRHQFDVFTLSCADHKFADLRPIVSNYNITEFRPGRMLNSPFGRLNQAIRLIDLLRLQSVSLQVVQKILKVGYDLIFVQPCQFENNPSLLSKLKGLPSLYYCHEPLRLLYETAPHRPYDQKETMRRRVLNRVDPLPILYYSMLRGIDRRNIRQADLVLVNSEFSRDNVYRIYQVKAKVSYHGVDTQLFRPKNAQKQKMVLSVGSLTPLKGFDFLIRAIAQIPTKSRPVLKIASNFQNAPERLYLEALAESLAVDLELLGNISDQKLVELYNQAILTVYAPFQEPFGLVPLESMACGTPVVAVGEGGVKETIIDGKTGYQVERDERLFAAAVEELISAPQVAMEFGHNGREHVLQNWTWEKRIAILENYWNEVSHMEKKSY